MLRQTLPLLLCSVHESSRRIEEQHRSRMSANRQAFAEGADEHGQLQVSRARHGSAQSLESTSAARGVATTVGDWDMSEAVEVDHDGARGMSGHLSQSVSASGDMSVMIMPGDSVSQQHGAPPKLQVRCMTPVGCPS